METLDVMFRQSSDSAGYQRRTVDESWSHEVSQSTPTSENRLWEMHHSEGRSKLSTGGRQYEQNQFSQS